MKEKENQKLIDSYDYLSNAASTHDCTSLKLCTCLSFSCIFKIPSLFCNILLYICKFSHCFFSIYSAVR